MNSNRHIVYVVLVSLGLISHAGLATQMVPEVSQIDMSKEFAYPINQAEQLRSTVVTILYELERQTGEKNKSAEQLQAALEALQSLFDVQKDRMKKWPEREGNNEWLSSQKEHLQAMLDRINSLIEYLESDDEEEVVRKVQYLKELSGELAEQIAQE